MSFARIDTALEAENYVPFLGEPTSGKGCPHLRPLLQNPTALAVLRAEPAARSFEAGHTVSLRHLFTRPSHRETARRTARLHKFHSSFRAFHLLVGVFMQHSPVPAWSTQHLVVLYLTYPTGGTNFASASQLRVSNCIKFHLLPRSHHCDGLRFLRPICASDFCVRFTRFAVLRILRSRSTRFPGSSCPAIGFARHPDFSEGALP